MLLAIPSASFGIAPSMTLAGPYRLDAVDAYLKADASDEDIVLLYPQGPPETSLGHPSFYSPYGHYYRLGGLGKQGYSLELPRERRVYYATPAALEDERAYLPGDATFELVETFGRTTLYAATIPSPPLAFHAAPGPWQVVVPPDGTPPAVSVPTGVSSSGTALDIRIETKGAEGWIAGQPLPVSPGGLVVAQLRIQGTPRYNTVHRAALQIVFLDANGARVGEDAAAPLHEVQHPSGSGWNVLRIARFAPPGAVRVQPRIRIDRYTQPGDTLAVRDFVLLLEAASR
jgi:hypothetical protein